MNKILSVILSLILVTSVVYGVSVDYATTSTVEYSMVKKGEPPRHAKNNKRHGRPKNTRPPRHAQNNKPRPVRQRPPNSSGTPNPAAKPHRAPPKPQVAPRPTRKKVVRVSPPKKRNSTQNSSPQRTKPRTEVAPEKRPRRIVVTRQAPRRCATVGPAAPRPQPWTLGGLFDGEMTVAKAAGMGIVTILFLMILILIGMYSGYFLGYKDKERDEVNFTRALLDRAKIRRS